MVGQSTGGNTCATRHEMASITCPSWLSIKDSRPLFCSPSAIWAYRPAPRRVSPRVESIYSKRYEKPKTACQRKPLAPLPIAPRPTRPAQKWVFQKAEKELTSLAVVRYGSGHRKGRLKILYAWG